MDGLVPMALQPAPMAARNSMLRRILVETIRTDPGYQGGNYTTHPAALHAAKRVVRPCTSEGTLPCKLQAQLTRWQPMGILLAFAPFVAFTIIGGLTGPTEGFVVAALVSVALLVRDWLTPGRHVSVLEIGTMLRSDALARHAVLGGPT